MPIDPANAGREFAPAEPVELAQSNIDAFNEAVGYRGPAAAPTFAFRLVVAAWQPMLADPSLDITLDRLVHADQRFALARPLVAGDEVVATARLTGVRPAAGADRLVVDTDLRTVEGERLGTTTSTLLCRHRSSR